MIYHFFMNNKIIDKHKFFEKYKKHLLDVQILQYLRKD